MTHAEYKKLLNGEAAKLKKLLEARKLIKKQLDEINKEITVLREGVIGLGALAGVNVRTLHADLFKADVQAHLGLTDAIREAFQEMDQLQGYTPSDVREELEEMGFPIHQHKNPLASVTTVLRRLVDAGFLIPATDRDTQKTVYYLAAGAGADVLRRQDEATEEE